MSKKKQPFNEWKHEVSFDMWQGELQNYEDGGEVSASSSPSFWERTFGGSNDGSPSGLAAYEGYTQEDAVRDAGFANVAGAQALGKSLENITPRDILEFVPVIRPAIAGTHFPAVWEPEVVELPVLRAWQTAVYLAPTIPLLSLREWPKRRVPRLPTAISNAAARQ